MRRHAKASSAGSTSGTGSSRGLFGRAFAVRGGLRDADGSGAPSGRLALALTVASLAVLFIAPAAQAGLVPGFGKLGPGTIGAGTGQIGTGEGAPPRGLAINHTGAGGVPSGSVYVSDSTNNRVSQFSGAGAFLRSFGWDVVSSGEHNSGANEQQNVAVRATGGNFTLTVTTANGSGTVTNGSNQITNVQASLGDFRVGDAITGTRIPANTTIIGVSGSTLTLSANPTTSTFATQQISNLVARETTANIPATASAAEVEAALEAKAGVGDVTVAGGPGNATGSAPYQVTFTAGLLSHNDIAQMTATGVALSGGTPSSTVTVSTPIAGGGYEICQAASTPTDVCKVGVANALAGGFAGAQGLAVDPATGNVFVVSNTNKRVDVFSATGQFQGAFGWSVNNTTPEANLQLCTTASGCKAGSAGAGAGQFGTMTVGGNVDAGASPTVSPLDGHLFVPQPQNRRIDEFSFTLSGSEVTGVSFVKGFGGDVAPTINERQTVTLTGASGGTFALSFGGKSTDVTGTGDVEAGSNEVTNFKVADGAFVVGEEVSGPGIPAGTRITAVSFDSLTLTNPASASAAGATLTAALPFDATAAAVQGALRGLASIGAGNAAVTGANGGPYTVEFTGKLAGTDVAQLSADASDLTGTTPTAEVTTTQTGANGAETGPETCTVATTCKASGGGELAAPQPGTFVPNTPLSLAADSTGAIYIAGQGGARECSLGGDTSGLDCAIQKYDPATGAVDWFAPERLASPVGFHADSGSRLVAVDPANDHVFVVKKISTTRAKILEFSRAGSFIESSPPGEAGLPVNGLPTLQSGPQGFVVGTEGRAYYLVTPSAVSDTPAVRIFGTPPAPEATVEAPTNVSQTSATFTGVAEPSAPGTEGGFATVFWFEYSSDGVSWTATDPIEIGDGSGAGNPNSCPAGNPPSCNVSRTVAGLKGGTTYLVRLVVSNGTKATSSTATFSTPDSAPGIAGLSASEVTGTSATLNGEIEPNGKVTSYHFEWGPTTAYGNRVPADLEAIAGGGNQTIPVSIQISGLQPATTYHYRIVAKSSSGTTTSPDQELMTLNASGLPSNRGIELVSPADKKPVGMVRVNVRGDQVSFRAAEEGGGVVYPFANGLDDSTAGGNLSFRAIRSSSGWAGDQVTPPSLLPAPKASIGGSNPGQVRYYSPSLSCAVIETFNPLTEDTPPVDLENAVYNLYLWRASDDSYTLITRQPPLNPTAISLTGGHYEIAGATPDCSRIFFQTQVYRFALGETGTYEWDEGALRDAGLRPDDSPAPSISSIAQDRYTVARDGRLFFTGTSNSAKDSGKKAVFVRKGPGQVVNASEPTSATPPGGAQYEAASGDGSNVFFLSNYGLTPTPSNGPAGPCAAVSGTKGSTPCGLYDYDVEAETLTEISATTDPANTQGAVVVGVVDVSADGETVYFAARGQLVPGEGRSYAQNTLGGGSANVYRYHDGNLSFVGLVDTPSLETALIRFRNNWTAQGTKNGQYLMFLSAVDMTGTNPQNLSEAYLYSAATGRLECVSCPKGRAAAAAAGLKRQDSFGGNGESPGHAGNWSPRLLSEDGRAFFTSTDALAPGAIQGEGSGERASTTNVYEWHRGQLSLLTSGRVQLVEIGGDNALDVFVRSDEQLVPEDFDFASDVYDLRIGSPGFAPPQPPVLCDPAADQCQGTPSAPPSAPSPASVGFQGAGNPPIAKPKPKRCAKGKVRKHGKCVRKKAKKKAGAHKRAADDNRGGAK